MTSTEPTSAAVDATAAGAADAESHEVVEDAVTEAAQTSGDAASTEDLAESASEASDAGDGGEETDAADSAETDDGETDDGVTENPLEVEAEVAADYLEELLDIADLDGDIDTYVDGDRAHVSIVSESTTLVGKDGEVLNALQELTRLAVLAETGQRSRLMLDVAGYRAQRRTELVALVADAVEEARASAEPVHLKAMNPFERKIVHDAVAAAGLTSESEGEEPRRHVVVLPTSD